MLGKDKVTDYLCFRELTNPILWTLCLHNGLFLEINLLTGCRSRIFYPLGSNIVVNLGQISQLRWSTRLYLSSRPLSSKEPPDGRWIHRAPAQV